MKATRKIVPALAMLLISVVLMSTASFAWFTMSRQVTAEGMNVTVTAPNNLLIAPFADKDDPSAYSEIYTYENLSGTTLQPASSIDGENLFVVKDGESLHADTGKLYTNLVDGKDTKLETATEAAAAGAAGVTAGYVDFKYTVKTDAQTDVKIVVNAVTVEQQAGGSQSLKPVRVAVIGDNTLVFNPAPGTNHDGKVVESVSGGVATLNTVTYATPVTNKLSSTALDDATVATINATGTASVDITVRVWYEGQDTDCVVANALANFKVSVILADNAALPD